MKERVKAIAERIYPNLVEVRRHLHKHPELSFEEVETAAYIRAQLEGLGLTAESVADTGLVAVIEGGHPGPVIALRGDMDALPIQELNEAEYCSRNPGVMHACGHDVHTTCLLGAAMVLNELRDSLHGSVKLIFQPGEEKLPGGAKLMIEQGVLTEPAPVSIVGQHVYPDLEVGKVGFRSGKYMASCDELYLTVKGRGGHAALPQQNIDPVFISAQIILALQQVVSRRSNPMTPTVLSFGKIQGNGATNIIPDEVHLAGTFRTFDEAWRSEAHGLITSIAQDVARASGGDCEVEIRKGYPFVDNDPEVTETAKNAAIEYLGPEQVIDLDMRATGEDFSYYTQVMPGTFYRLGTRNEERGIVHPIHSPKFDVDESCLLTGSGLMAYIALKQLTP